HAGTDTPDEALLEDRRDLHLLGDDLLDLVQDALALGPVELLGLTLEEVVDLGQRAVGVHAALGHERLQPRRRVAGRAGGADHQALQLPVMPAPHHPPPLPPAYPRLALD